MTSHQTPDQPSRRSGNGPRRHLARSGVLAATIAMLAGACSAGDGAGPSPAADREVAVAVAGADSPAGDAVVARADVALGHGVGFDVDHAVEVDQGDGTIDYSGSLGVPVAGGDVALDNAEVVVEIDPDTGEARLVGGRAALPFPTTGVFADASVNSLPIGDMGIAMGRELRHLGAHLHDDREYLYFAFDGGLDVGLPFAGRPGFEAIPATISVPTGVSAVMVLDPTDPYFYIGGACPELPDKDDDDRGETDKNDKGEKDEENEALVTVDPSDLPPGEDCGIGFSLNGNIPAPAPGGGTPFTGHVVVDGVVPLYAGIELDGSVVVRVGPEGARTAGWGDVLATVPVIDRLVDVRIPLADAAVDVQAEGVRIGLTVDGTVGGSEPTYELPLLGIPVTIPAAGRVDWSASYGFVRSADGTWSVDPTSFAEASGEFGMGLGAFGELIGLSLDDALAQTARVRIDSSGVTIAGSMNAQIHPALRTGGAADIDVFVSAADWTQSHLAFDADVEVLGHRLAAASVSLDSDGLFVDGSLDIGALAVDMGGVIAADEVTLTGSVVVDLDLDGIAQGARTASGALDEAIATVESLDTAIEQARDEVRESRRNRDAGFVTARRVPDDAIASLDAIDDTVAANERRIRELQGKIRAEKQWYAGLGPLEATWEWTGHTARLTGWNGEIAALATANVTQRDVYRPAAVFTLEQAQNALDLLQRGLDALPVDTNPRVASLIASREAALVTLHLVQDGVELFDIGGSLRGELFVQLGTSGIEGSIEAEACGDSGCITLGAARLVAGPQPELCAEFPGIGEQCLAL